MDTHILKGVEKVEFTDKHGRKRTRLLPRYSRSEETQADMEKLRLGSLANVIPTQDPEAKKFLEQHQVIIVAPYPIARVLAATRLRQDTRPHRLLTGVDILRSYLDKEGSANRTFQEGFPNYPQLYLMFGFIEAPNSYLPSLILQLVGQRYHEAKDVYLFLPRPPAVLAGQWTGALADLNYLPILKYEHLSDSGNQEGPSTRVLVKKDQVSSQVTENQTPIQTQDPKFTPRDKRRH